MVIRLLSPNGRWWSANFCPDGVAADVMSELSRMSEITSRGSEAALNAASFDVQAVSSAVSEVKIACSSGERKRAATLLS